MRYPSKALSIMQPWAWCITSAGKDIENRDWATRYRGPVLIHAGKRADRDAMEDLAAGLEPGTGRPLRTSPLNDMPLGMGGIVGMAEIVDCVTESKSPWFFGLYGFVLRNARPLPFRSVRGALGFFPVDYAALAAQPTAPKEPRA